MPDMGPDDDDEDYDDDEEEEETEEDQEYLRQLLANGCVSFQEPLSHLCSSAVDTTHSRVT